MKKLVLQFQPLCMNREVQFSNNNGLKILKRRRINLPTCDDGLQKVDGGGLYENVRGRHSFNTLDFTFRLQETGQE
jgi:hypothetical protein